MFFKNAVLMMSDDNTLFQFTFYHCAHLPASLHISAAITPYFIILSTACSESGLEEENRNWQELFKSYNIDLMRSQKGKNHC